MEAPEFYGAAGAAAAAAAAATAGFCSTQFTTEKHQYSLDSNKPCINGGGDHFIVEDLLDLPNEDVDDDDAMITDASTNDNNNASSCFDTVASTTDYSSSVTVVDSCNSSSNFSSCEPCFNGDIGSHLNNNFSHHDVHFGSELCVPYDDLAELEWLSNFVEESFSSEDLQRLQLISGRKTRSDELYETRHFQPERDSDDNTNGNISSNINNSNTMFNPEMSVPAKARSKRSRAAPGNWASRLLVLSPTTSSSDPEIVVGPAQHPTSGKKTVKGMAGQKKRDSGGEGVDGRKCLHCATDKTPQWRTGPMGPKTLCNACGVRYKSGRLVPEYRPAASPTFVLTKHSNSHRKVIELRRQKELLRAQQHHQQQQFLHHHHHHQNMVFDVSNGGDDYLIHQHVGPDFRQMI